MEVMRGSVVSDGNGAKPPKGGGQPAAGEKARGAAKKATGRKDASKQEAALQDSVLRELAPELQKQKKLADDEAEHYSDMVKAAAEKTGYHASTIRSVIAALASDDFEDKKGKAEQLSLAFEALA
jgi:hypothetical protein